VDARANPSQAALQDATTASPDATTTLENVTGTFAGAPMPAGDNRTTSGGLPSKSPRRTSQTVTQTLAAGATTSFPIPGNNLRVIVASGPLMIRPNPGSWMTLYQGMSYKPHNKTPWTLVEVQNPSASPVVFVLFLGFGKVFDNRQIPNLQILQRAVVGQYTSNATIPDRSGTIITDQSGAQFYAISRQSVQIYVGLSPFLLTTYVGGITILGGATNTTSNPVAIQGTLSVSASASNGNVIEIYNCIAINPAP
jgi:hypothetical protein